MTDKTNTHIAEQIANTFNDNSNKAFFRSNFQKFKEAITKVNKTKQLTSLEKTVFIKGYGKVLANSMTPEEKLNLSVSPYKYPDFLEEQSPESLKKQLLRTFEIDWLNPPDSEV